MPPHFTADELSERLKEGEDRLSRVYFYRPEKKEATSLVGPDVPLKPTAIICDKPYQSSNLSLSEVNFFNQHLLIQWKVK